jgi:hypothetical protein
MYLLSLTICYALQRFSGRMVTSEKVKRADMTRRVLKYIDIDVSVALAGLRLGLVFPGVIMRFMRHRNPSGSGFACDYDMWGLGWTYWD